MYELDAPAVKVVARVSDGVEVGVPLVSVATMEETLGSRETLPELIELAAACRIALVAAEPEVRVAELWPDL